VAESGGVAGLELLVLLVPAVGALLALVGIWAGVAVHRQVRLLRMQRWAAWNWEMARKFPASAEEAVCGVGGYRPQAEHLDRHIRAARDGWPDDDEAA
jgi:hypothetical protein